MHARIDGHGQVVIPARARKEAHIVQGDVVSIQPAGDGRIVLLRLDRPRSERTARPRVIHRKGKHPVVDIGRRITREEIRTALGDFP